MKTSSRFEEATRNAGRQRAVSAAAVAVMTAGSRIARVIERSLMDARLTLPQFNVLMELAATPDGVLPMHEMTDRLISTPPSMSGLTSRMRDLGLITKQRSSVDERVVLLGITETGWEALEQAMPLVFDAEVELLGRHSQSELRQIVDVAQTLTD